MEQIADGRPDDVDGGSDGGVVAAVVVAGGVVGYGQVADDDGGDLTVQARHLFGGVGTFVDLAGKAIVLGRDLQQ